MEVPIELCQKAKVYKKDPARRMILLSILVALYAFSIPYSIMTAGDPRRAAMETTQRLADEKWAKESASIVPSAEFNETIIDIDIDEQEVQLNLPNQENDVSQQFDEFESDQTFEFKGAAKKSSGESFLANWFGISKEQKRAQAEFEKWRKDFQEKSGETVSLPPEYLPSAWACLALFASFSFHALFYLMCHWVVTFKAMTLFKPATKVEEGSFVLVEPPPNRGKADMVEVKKSLLAGGVGGSLLIEFQRQKYMYTPAAKLGERARDYLKGVFTLSTYPVNLPLTSYLSAKGLNSEGEVKRLLVQWGENHLAVAIPSFLELLKLQLLSPLAIFQVFCSLLWLLDDYWTYTLFTLVTVVIYEATTVFQRTRTQKMLGGMAPKPTPVYVFRGGKWVLLTTKSILPGDLVSLSCKKRTPSQSNNNGTVVEKGSNEDTEDKRAVTLGDGIVPCDCLLLYGSAVINEASLTGESVPQMKDALTAASTGETDEKGEDPVLDMNGMHRVHTLFSGTSLVAVDIQKDGGTHISDIDEGVLGLPGVPLAPDGGAIAYVLRTGFGSSQGALLQMIEFSQQTVSGDTRETGMALLLLFVFALFASGYVLKEGLRKKEKTTHELLLKCVIIITSVVPRQFPMQMAMAVNMALMALNKAGIFCTEPYRVPLAGKISHCLFDKTGTLTTDQLVPVGIINHDAEVHGSSNNSETPQLVPMKAAHGETEMVLAACHSLVVVESGGPGGFELAGDPIELAAMQGIEWHWDAGTSTATPDGAVRKAVKTLTALQERAVRHQQMTQDLRGPNHGKELQGLQKAIQLQEEKVRHEKSKPNNAKYEALVVEQRHHFSSKLQRMSVVCRAKTGEWFCLVKGSPEALKQLMTSSAIPSWYTKCYESMARRGLRVLALGYRRVSAGDSPASQPRAWVEKDLQFGGLIAFECKIRADSAVVIQALRDSDHRVAMLTGDALLTSLHVARETNICDKKLKSLVLTSLADEDVPVGGSKVTVSDVNSLVWTVYDEAAGDVSTIPFEVEKVESLSKDHNLLSTEDTFKQAVAATGEKESPLWRQAGRFKVFARMSPQGKAAVIEAIQQEKDTHVFMCGDGGNDVGALKQADVGLALLAGHANANTTEDVASAVEKASPQGRITGTPASGEEAKAEDALNAHQQQLQKRNEAVNKARAAHMKEFQARYTREQQAELQEKLKELTEKGEYMAMFTLMKDQAGNIKKAMNRENARYMAMHGQVWDPAKDGDGTDGAGANSMQQLMDSFDSADTGGLPIVRPGDASVAAPFTSRVPSVRAVVDLIRQGRCTLLSSLMQQQIMMLESTIAAYTLSSLSLHNARSSERQMMASSWLITTAALSFSYASPLDKMHPLRPLRSLFHPAIILSILGQAAIHIACMTLAVKWATEAMGPEKLEEVTEFFRKAKAKEIDRAAHCEEDDWSCQLQAYWTAPFLPNLLNSVVFLVETSQMISVFFVNYKGRPWMKGMVENHPLFLSVFICIGGVAIAAWELFPQLNELIQLAPFPDDLFRYKVVILVISTIFGSLLWDRLCVAVFAPQVSRASMDEAKKLTWRDFLPIGLTVAKICGGLVLLGTGNILLIGGAIWYYRSFMNKQKAAGN